MTRLAGRYTLGEVLGEGGMGRVWRAYDDVTRREVAVKEIHARVSAERAIREARAMARLRHAEIVRIHDVLDVDDRPWIVMELLDGRALDEVIAERGGLPPEEVAAIGRGVLRALRHAHRQGVVHRDVKPANVFVRPDGRIVLTDFGISSLDGEDRLTATGFAIGTPGFVAPERLRHADLPPEPAADLFSLGALLYMALTGTAPFARATPLASLTAPLTDRPARPAGPPALVAAILGMLSADPGRRAAAAHRLTEPRVTAPAREAFRGVRLLGAVLTGKVTVREALRPARELRGVLIGVVAVASVMGLGYALRGVPDPSGDPASPSPSSSSSLSPRSPLPASTPVLDFPVPTLDPDDLESLMPTRTFDLPTVDVCDIQPDLC
ncbi:serine/threonine protein kinase [Actinocorallia herbida]|uniref:non-specific serine/threonine protein kinase n=1 Tax=Actinocorallia herbida TaxID=58109 RepID=A0A3N1CY47_9ACTN|nr:serine/threonine-protein kinase [Actinocorallia herbida]ROO86220.1 serine/threonine protein kinase [Actinocorallia herbida]